MGTSGSYPGPSGSNPLIPTWLEPMPGGDQPQNPDPNSAPDGEAEGQSNNTALPAPAREPSVSDTTRFPGSKSAFSRYVGSGGGNRSALGRAVAGYVSRANGGSRNATARMGASRASAGRILNFLSQSASRGVTETLKSFNLGNLAGKSLVDILLGVADAILPTDGTIDSGIARDAYAETIVDLMESDIAAVDVMTDDVARVVLETFLTNSIFERIRSDVGNGLIQLPNDIRETTSIQEQIKDFISGRVKDAVGPQLDLSRVVSEADGGRMATDIYQSTFDLLSNFDDD